MSEPGCSKPGFVFLRRRASIQSLRAGDDPAQGACASAARNGTQIGL
jgi:hypothetical protein